MVIAPRLRRSVRIDARRVQVWLLHNTRTWSRARRSTATAAFGVTSTDFDNLAALVTFCCLAQLLPLPLLRLIPENLGGAEEDGDGGGAGGGPGSEGGNPRELIELTAESKTP